MIWDAFSEPLQGHHFEELVTKICFGAKNVIQGVLMVLRDFPENFLDSGGPSWASPGIQFWRVGHENRFWS